MPEPDPTDHPELYAFARGDDSWPGAPDRIPELLRALGSTLRSDEHRVLQALAVDGGWVAERGVFQTPLGTVPPENLRRLVARVFQHPEPPTAVARPRPHDPTKEDLHLGQSMAKAWARALGEQAQAALSSYDLQILGQRIAGQLAKARGNEPC